MGWFKDPAVDKLLDDAREEMNRAKRQKLYEDAQKLIMEQAAMMPLFNQVQPDVAAAAVEGLRLRRQHVLRAVRRLARPVAIRERRGVELSSAPRRFRARSTGEESYAVSRRNRQLP